LVQDAEKADVELVNEKDRPFRRDFIVLHQTENCARADIIVISTGFKVRKWRPGLTSTHSATA